MTPPSTSDRVSIVPSTTKGAAKGLSTVILAGGKGVRLKPFTINFPKPLVPLGDTPIIEVLIRRLLEYGLTDITLALGHLSGLIKSYFLNHRELSSEVSLRFVEEEEPTGTAGSLASIQGLDSTFLAMNGDLLTDLNFDELVSFHREQNAALTIAVHRRRVKLDFGVIKLGDDHRVVDYDEKPEDQHDVSMGIYVYEPMALKYVQRGRYLDFPELVLRLLDAGEKVSAWPYEGLWLDIGRPSDYAKAQELYSRTRPELLADVPEEI
jgi:NDP-sugar pyrophosphorylase family protein